VDHFLSLTIDDDSRPTTDRWSLVPSCQNDQVVIVDGANVVGSRPDGWWRDRPGAARRLHDRLVSAVATGALDPPVVLVLEGAARRGVPEGTTDHVEVVHAPGSGDDTIVELAATPDVMVVTADRELRQRVTELGAAIVGPSWLHERCG
jgi:hypothetical protein